MRCFQFLPSRSEVTHLVKFCDSPSGQFRSTICPYCHPGTNGHSQLLEKSFMRGLSWFFFVFCFFSQSLWWTPLLHLKILAHQCQGSLLSLLSDKVIPEHHSFKQHLLPAAGSPVPASSLTSYQILVSKMHLKPNMPETEYYFTSNLLSLCFLMRTQKNFNIIICRSTFVFLQFAPEAACRARLCSLDLETACRKNSPCCLTSVDE